ncbi:hypothetical protein BBR47_19410 [Brevibacillus brevis NBRC 100599]|uniref:Uncharacterized protein n=1 Tax=Brevibacillus brevis (strain 47 / JCM 6285 / NBRC 100599) TaxID=358681 RepID=C0ZAV9_BREBN|nr:hypothetical protein BBR47_19410 [Brevibacillus brevis NBRC 100599]
MVFCFRTQKIRQKVGQNPEKNKEKNEDKMLDVFIWPDRYP